jgi:hypothetical protein
MIKLLDQILPKLRYPRPMDIVVTHMSALGLLRLPTLADALATASPLPLRVPAALPDAAELAEKARALADVGLAASPLELMVSDPSSRTRTEAFLTHTQQERLPLSSFIRVADGIWVVSFEHLCAQLATRLTRVELLVLMGELLGTYSLTADGMFSRTTPLMTRASLGRHLAALGDFHGARVARDALALAPENSASPMETKLFLRTSLPYRFVGYALPVKALNEPLEVGRIGEPGAMGERRPDITLLSKEGGAAPCAFVALEYDGEGHLTRAQQAADQRRSNEILAFGGREYHVNKELYDSLPYMDDLMGRVAVDLGRAPCRVTRAVREKRRWLRGELKRELDLIDGVAWGGRARAKAAGKKRGPSVEVAANDRVPLDAYWF